MIKAQMLDPPCRSPNAANPSQCSPYQIHQFVLILVLKIKTIKLYYKVNFIITVILNSDQVI